MHKKICLGMSVLFTEATVKIKQKNNRRMINRARWFTRIAGFLLRWWFNCFYDNIIDRFVTLIENDEIDIFSRCSFRLIEKQKQSNEKYSIETNLLVDLMMEPEDIKFVLDYNDRLCHVTTRVCMDLVLIHLIVE